MKFAGSFARAVTLATNGSCAHWHKPLAHYLTAYRSEFFHTLLPNLDIRHGSNFTGPKRGKHRCFELAPWGRFTDVMGRA